MLNGATSIKRLTDDVIGAALQDPRNAPLILRQGARTFAGLAKDPKNARVAQRLQDVAFEFAEMARQQQQQPTVDEFHQLVADTAEAYDHEGADDMAVIAERRMIEAERDAWKRMSIAPESWDSDATLGRTATIKWNPSDQERIDGVKQSETVAFWQGHKREAQAISVDVNLVTPYVPPTSPGALATPGSARPYAIIEYGSDGNTNQVKIDACFGRRFTVLGNYVSVVMGMDPPATGRSSVTMTVGASLGTFAAPSQAPVTLTSYIDSLANGSQSDYIQRPTRAVQVLPILTDAIAGNIRLDLFDVDGSVAPIATLIYPVGTMGISPIAIPNDVGYARIMNQTGQASNFRLIWQLSL